MSADPVLAIHLGQPDTSGEDHFTTVIEPTRGWAPLELDQLWRYRELLYFLAWRDIKVRYKQTVLGAAWVVVQPLVTVLIFTVVFGHFAKIPSEGVPYPVFAFCGLLPWTFFATALTRSSNSLVTNANLVSKVYFPRLIMPLSASLAGLLDFAISFVVLLVMMLVARVAPTAGVVFLPFFLLLALAAALALGLWFSALNVRYRDVNYLIPFIAQIGVYATPVAYPASLIHNNLLHAAYFLNPMAGAVEGFRWALLGSKELDLPSLGISVAVTVALLIGGLYYFRRMEQQFADVV